MAGERLPYQDAPDAYDRQLGLLHDLPDVTRVREATVRVVPPLGVGGSQVFIIQTYRQQNRGDTIFLEVAGNGGNVRLVIPPAVSGVIARQRDALTGKSRSAAATRAAEDRKARGIAPGFLRKKKGGAA